MEESAVYLNAYRIAYAPIMVLIGVFVSVMVSYSISKRSVYISSVTAERSKWIDKLRGNISDLLGVLSTINMAMPDIGSDEAKKNRSEADRIISLISMQLNPMDESGIDKNLMHHLRLITKSAEKSPDIFRLEERKFIRHCQFLLKEEWEKVKYEASKGVIPLFKDISLMWYFGAETKKRKIRDAEYRRFYLNELMDS